MDCTIRKGLTGLLAGSMLFLSGFARAGEAADENRGYPATQDATEIPAVQAGGNSAASGFDTSSETDGNTRTDSTAAFPAAASSTVSGWNSARNTCVRPIRSSRATIWPGSRSTCRWPPTCATRSASSPDRVPTGYTEAPIRESGSPTTVSKTGRSWAAPSRCIFSKGRASRG